MKKKNLITAVGAGVVGAGAAGYLLMNDDQKSKVKEKIGKLMNNNKEEGSVAHTFEKAGQPDQIEQTDISDHENAKMVSEGSQFGVQYYNEKQSEEAPLQ